MPPSDQGSAKTSQRSQSAKWPEALDPSGQGKSRLESLENRTTSTERSTVRRSFRGDAPAGLEARCLQQTGLGLKASRIGRGVCRRHGQQEVVYGGSWRALVRVRTEWPYPRLVVCSSSVERHHTAYDPRRDVYIRPRRGVAGQLLEWSAGTPRMDSQRSAFAQRRRKSHLSTTFGSPPSSGARRVDSESVLRDTGPDSCR